MLKSNLSPSISKTHTIGIIQDIIPIMSSPSSPLEKFRAAIQDSPSYMVEQFALLHSNYLDDTHPGAAERYRAKIGAIQDLCAASLAHIQKEGGRRPSLRQLKTKKKRRNNR
jgi:hypothetical protein